MTSNHEIHLKNRPIGLPSRQDFELVEVTLPTPGPNEVLVRNDWMSVDPAMRGRMHDIKSYKPPFQLDAAPEGPAVGRVIASNDPSLKVGDIVYSEFGWREIFVAPASQLEKLNVENIPPQAFLGIAGMPGLTAYVGLLRIAKLKEGDVVFVSAASGAVGSLVCQIAKIKGHKVIGSAGGPEKCAYLKDELGLDEVIDYKAVPSLTKALAQAAPEGIDVYFDNVGGEHLQAAIAIANRFARFAICGMISQYNLTSAPYVPRNLVLIMGKALRLQGYIVSFHNDMKPAFRKDIAQWHSQGKLKWKETIIDGLDKAPDALIGLFEGQNFGKMLVKLNPDAK
ncbi:MAG: NADP-dependent oxidoreductase [Emcibacter sp.]|nr:NADP-dependent oxidoreductase [Emcibacter sp.]